MNPTTVAAGLVGALVVAGLVAAIGVGDVASAYGRADPVRLLGVAGAAGCWFVAWALSLRAVLGVLGAPVGVGRALLVFGTTTFANNATPFGQAGGEPLGAYFVSKVTDREYQTGFAAIASTDALHFVPSLSLGLVGLGYYAATVALGRRLTSAAVVVAALAVVLPAAAYAGWHGRERLERFVARAATPVARAVARVVPRVDPPTEATVERRVDGFFRDVERVATDRRGLAAALAFSAVGWVALAASLWLCLFALGHAVPVAAVLVAVPVGDLGALVPFPGGLGGVEVLLVGLLVGVTPVPAAVAGAAVLLHRGATFWLPLVVGGSVAGFVVSH